MEERGGFERGSLGLEGRLLDVEEYVRRLAEHKLELLNGQLLGGGAMRAGLLRLLMENAGLREVVRLAPRALWLQALAEEEPPGAA